MLTRLALVSALATLGVAAAAPAVVETARSVATPITELPTRGAVEAEPVDRPLPVERPLAGDGPQPRSQPPPVEATDGPLVDHGEGCLGHGEGHHGKGHHKARGKGHHKARGGKHGKGHGKHKGHGKNRARGKHRR